MAAAMLCEPRAASDTLRFISFVVAVCSSTAAAMVDWKSLISAMTELIWLIASTAPAVSAWMACPRDDVLGRPGRLLGQFLDLAGDDGEALARLARRGPPRWSR